MNRSIALQSFVGRKGVCLAEMFNPAYPHPEWDWVRGEVVGVGSSNEPDEWLTWGRLEYPEGWTGFDTVDISFGNPMWKFDE